MKILHTADWHLGKRLDRFERLPEQALVLSEICEIAEKENVDAVIIAGDLYDNFNPPVEAIELFYRTLKRLGNGGRRAVVAIAGNHDSPYRIEAPDPLAREHGIIFAGFPDSEIRPFRLDSGLEVTRSEPGFIELKLPGHELPLRILLTPYANEIRLKQALETENPETALREVLRDSWKTLADRHLDGDGINLLVAHLFMMKKGGEVPEEPEDERPINIGGACAVFTNDIPGNVHYTALGHLHRYQVIDGAAGPAVYSSSILPYSFSEAGQKKYVSLIRTNEKEGIQHRAIELKAGFPLYKKTFGSVENAVEWLNDNQDCYVELTIETDSYLSAADRKIIARTHPRVIGPIPKITGFRNEAESNAPIADPGKSIDELFRDYFRKHTGNEINEELLAIFGEIKAKEAGE